MAATKSLFSKIYDKYFTKTAKFLYNKINGSKDEPTYWHDQMLDEEYSVDMTYDSISGNFTRVTADIVAFDSPAPIKSRSAIKSASGEIVKMSLKFVLTERQMNTVRILSRMPGRVGELVKKIFADTESCILGIKEKIEQAHLIGFSSGITLIEDAQNVGTGVRINYNIPPSNQFGVTSLWSDSTSKPMDDIKRVMEGASRKGRYPKYIWMDPNIVDNLLNNAQLKEQFAFNQNFVGANVPTLSGEQVAEVFRRRFGLEVKVVDRTFVHEKNKVLTYSKGWTPNMVVFTQDVKVGSLVYSTLAEAEYKQEGVAYAEPNPYILISKSGTTDPVSEKTQGQALVIPVLQDVDGIFYLNSAEATASKDAQTEGDANYAYKGTNYTRTSVIAGINAARDAGEGKGVAEAKASNADSTLATKIDGLSEAGITIFEATIVAA